MGLGPRPGHDVPGCRRCFEPAPGLRPGDCVLAERGWGAGATIPLLKPQRPVDVIGPRQSTLVSSHEAMPWANLPETWQPHPARAPQPIAWVQGMEHLGEAWKVPLKAWVIRYGKRKKDALDPIVWVATEQRLKGPWSIRHEEERPESAQEDEHMQSGGWQLKKRSATRYRESVLSLPTVVWSYRLYHRFANTQAGARFADRTRQALAFAPLRSCRTHVIVLTLVGIVLYQLVVYCERLVLTRLARIVPMRVP